MKLIIEVNILYLFETAPLTSNNGDLLLQLFNMLGHSLTFGIYIGDLFSLLFAIVRDNFEGVFKFDNSYFITV
jgi:hypothetical protein